MKNCKVCFIITAIVTIFLFMQINIYGQVTVQLQQPPAFQFKIEHMWKVTLINTTNSAYTVYLKGSATESVQGQIIEATTSSFLLSPGVKVINMHELMPMKIDVTNSKYSDVVQNIGGLPTGDYEICVSVINVETDAQLGIQCVQANTQNLSHVELLQPENQTVFLSGAVTGNNSDNLFESKIISGSFITFSWLPPTPIPPGVKVTYSLKIVEMFGNQSPYDAVLSNNAFYINQNIFTNIFLYPVNGRNFNNNKRYAWKVNVYLNNTIVSESETWEFTYTDNSQQNKTETIAALENEEEKIPNLYFKRQLLLASTDDSQLLSMIYDNESENKTEPILFSGNAKLNFNAGYVDLPFSELPKSSLTAELSPSVAIYGLPFTANILLSTQQGSDRQSINSFTFNLDIDSYKDQLKSRLEEKVSEMTTGWEDLLLSVNEFGIGTNYPTYTDYTLKGVPVTGISVEVNPGIFYAAFAASKNQRSIENLAFQRNLYAGRIGIGKKENTHFFFTGLYVKDDENSTTLLPDNLTLTPKANYVLGAETKLHLFDEHILIEGEGNVAVLTRDTRDAELDNKAIPNWIKRMITPKLSTSFDYSYAGKMSYNNSESATRISFGMKMIGPGYTTLGAPNLRNDLMAYEGKVEQRFLDKKVSLSSFFRTSHDNLIDWKSSTTTTSAYGINLGLNFPSLPYLQVSYSPYVQKNNDIVPTQKINNKTTMLSAVTGYLFLIDEYNFSTNIAFSRNEAKSINGFSDYLSNSFSVTEGISFSEPISFSGTYGLIKTTSPLFYSSIHNFDFSINETYLEFISNTLGFNLAYEWDINKKTVFYINSAVTLLENINFNIKIEGTSFKNNIDTSLNYNDLVLHAMISAAW